MPNEYRIMIACVTVETVMVSDPVIFYRPDEIHLFHYSRDPESSRARLYEDHYLEVYRRIRDIVPESRIIGHHDVPIYDFRSMARCLEF